jgi:hypothetical protein
VVPANDPAGMETTRHKAATVRSIRIFILGVPFVEKTWGLSKRYL